MLCMEGFSGKLGTKVVLKSVPFCTTYTVITFLHFNSDALLASDH